MDKNRYVLIDLFFVVLWIYSGYGFVAEEFLPFLVSMKSEVFFICDIICILLGLKYLKSKIDILFLAFFFIISLLSSVVINHLTPIEYINGFRDFSSLILITPFIKYNLVVDSRGYFIRQFNRYIKYFLIIQIPCSLWQFVEYGPGDYVGGSMGAYNSGILSTLVFIMTFYLMSQRFDPNYYLQSIRKNSYLFIFWLPSFINETKISFIFIPFFFLCLMKINYTLVFKYTIFGAIFIFIVFPFLFKAYMSITNTNIEYLTLSYMYDDEFMDKVDSNDTGELYDMPRFTKIVESVNLLSEQNLMVIGKGIGHFKGGTSIASTSFYKEYDWLLFGSIPYLFFLFIQLGIVGIVFFLYYFGYHFYKGFQNNETPLSKNIVLYLCVIFILILFYNDSFRLAYFSIPFMYVLLFAAYPKVLIDEEED